MQKFANILSAEMSSALASMMKTITQSVKQPLPPKTKQDDDEESKHEESGEDEKKGGGGGG